MREIKFRQPVINNNKFSKWHYWGLIDGSFIGPHSNWRLNGSYQYTGLKDKNGKEIWEGDVLDFDESEWGGKFKPEVIWLDKIINDWEYCGTLSDVSEWRSVIGNIYENPEYYEFD